MIYSIDFETRSFIDLKKRGLDVYANDPTTEVLCIAFGTTPDNVSVNKPIKYNSGVKLGFSDTDCQKLLDHIAFGGKIQAWNALFEYAIWNCVCVPKYGWPELKLEQCIDSMAIAAANNVPQALGDCSIFLNSEYKKDPIGQKLIQKLCKPNTKGVYNNDPELLSQLYDYCIRDVQTEMGIAKQLRSLSGSEQAIWELTQRINIRGVPVDPEELQNAVNAVKNAQTQLDDELLSITNCKPSERAKLLNWLNTHGADMKDLTAESVEKMLQSTKPSVIKRVLELRQEGSQTSVAKYAKMLEIQRNGRIRNTLVYHGASTGRWASRGGLNLQNIARPTLSDSEVADALGRVFEQGYGAMSELSSLVRSAISAPSGQTFVDVDFSSIENRVGVWLAGQKDKVELFRKGLDEYKVFASESLYNVPYDEVTKDQRQVSKSAVLGAMFGQGATGLVRYAEGMGVKISEEQAKNSVEKYRNSYAKVKALWHLCEEAAKNAILNPGQGFKAGNKLWFQCAKNALWLKLPSARLICWQGPKFELVETPWGDTRYGITVHSQSTYSREWKRNQLIGSSIFQSAVQGTARDFLANAMIKLEHAGYELVNSIHDEVLLLVDEQNGESALQDVIKIMTTPPTWASDFPLAAEGWHGKRYRK
jgi:DNA polymerase